MPLIDDRGRLFGKLNLIDAIVWAFVLLLIPLAYGAYLLFRPPPLTITSMRPVSVIERMPTSVTIAGQNLRPYLRARVGQFEAQFLVQTPNAGELKLPEMPPGTYDLSLYDEETRVLFSPAAFTVQAMATSSVVDLEAVGTFVEPSKDGTALFSVGAKFQPSGAGAGASAVEVLAVRPPELTKRRVRIGSPVVTMASLPGPSYPAIVRIPCLVGKDVCTFGRSEVSRGETIPLEAASPDRKGPSSPRQALFVIDQLFPAGTHAAFPSVLTARIRFVGGPELSSVLKVGEADTGPAIENDPPHLAIFGGVPAMLTAVVSEPAGSAQVTTETAEPQANGTLLTRRFQLQQPAMAFTCTVRIPAVFTQAGWQYKERLLKVGLPFVFESAGGKASGWILDVKDSPDKPDSPK